MELAEIRYPQLVEIAYAYYGGILTQLLRELSTDSLAWATHSRDIKAKLWLVLRMTWRSQRVPVKSKIRWLLAVASGPQHLHRRSETAPLIQ